MFKGTWSFYANHGMSKYACSGRSGGQGPLQGEGMRMRLRGENGPALIEWQSRPGGPNGLILLTDDL